MTYLVPWPRRVMQGEVKIYFLISGDYALAAEETPDRFSKNQDRYNQQRALKLWILLNVYHLYEFDWNQLRFRWEGARTPPGVVTEMLQSSFDSKDLERSTPTNVKSLDRIETRSTSSYCLCLVHKLACAMFVLWSFMNVRAVTIH
ncbi:uncharacterized protein LOC134197508 isoform X2 [Corticium candelabrum]|uniref:uncharacterized protein LOC134197508 isoform X2 n=1 Tax=Corticium candelabrum TaxID=121492 RepID=UPI002E270C79|nr:uncharacterized protein LOC134197508 isoform X2 [Corticium candelabrum]